MKLLFSISFCIIFTLNYLTVNGQTLTITAPNGGEIWQSGANAIRWSDNISENVVIDLFKNNGYYLTIDPSTQSDGYYAWTVPDTITTGSDYKIKITSTNNNLVTDLSDSSFTIVGRKITITAPNGGEIWQSGANAIRWSDNISENVVIDLFKNNGYYLTIDPSTQSDGYYAWTVPDTITTGSDYKIKITSTNNNLVTDLSDGNYTIGKTTDLSLDSNMKIVTYNLFQNYPNPFNPTTKIRYQLPKESKVVIKIYTILGSEVFQLVSDKKESGIYEVEFKAENLPSGIYIYRIVADNFVQTKKMIFLK